MTENKIIDGKEISNRILEEVKEETRVLKDSYNTIPGLAFIIVGENPASKVYVSSKAKACEKVGFYSVTEELPEDVSENELLMLIERFNNDKLIHGILVQLPLPKHINEQKVIESIDYKDVDGFHPQNIGRLVIGTDCFIPCTPYGITELLRRTNTETSGKNVVVLGRSNIVGKPIANLMVQKEFNSTVTICHSATKNLNEITASADILIAAIGKADFVKKDMIKEGCVIIDVGINRVEDASKKIRFKNYRGCRLQ